MPYALLTTHYPLPTTNCSLLTTHYSLLTTHYSLLTMHCSLLATRYSLLTPYQAAATACPRAVPQCLRGGRQRCGHPHTLWLGRHASGKGRLGGRTSCRLGHLGTCAFGPVLLCALQRRASAAQTPVAASACGAASRPCPRPVYLLLPLTAHHSPLTTHHSPLTTHHSPLTRSRRGGRDAAAPVWPGVPRTRGP